MSKKIRERVLTTWLCARGGCSEHSGVCRRTELPRRSEYVEEDKRKSADHWTLCERRLFWTLGCLQKNGAAEKEWVCRRRVQARQVLVQRGNMCSSFNWLMPRERRNRKIISKSLWDWSMDWWKYVWLMLTNCTDHLDGTLRLITENIILTSVLRTLMKTYFKASGTSEMQKCAIYFLGTLLFYPIRKRVSFFFSFFANALAIFPKYTPVHEKQFVGVILSTHAFDNHTKVQFLSQRNMIVSVRMLKFHQRDEF